MQYDPGVSGHDDHDHPHDDHGHDHDDHGDGDEGHEGHTHGRLTAADPDALRVVLLSSVVLAVVAAVELTGAFLSDSAGILADGLHNLGDVSTTIALAAAFLLSRRAPSARFPYGYHRGEDLAGLLVLVLMVVSAVASGVTSVEHLIHRTEPHNLGLGIAVALAGLVGNEVVAQYKVASGKRLKSMALVADGKHSRVDGLASLGAAIGLGGAALGFPILDPIAGLAITVVIATVALDTARNVTARLLDEADASLVDTIAAEAAATPGVISVTSVRARWTGRRVRAEMTVEVDPAMTVSVAHGIAEEVRHRLHHKVESLATVMVHLDPAGESEAHSHVAHHD